MNERIRELRRQVKVDPNKFHSDPEFFKNHVEPLAKIFDNGNNALLNDYMTKFAELIIKECIEQVWYSREDYINENISEVIKQRMKQHFGVEE